MLICSIIVKNELRVLDVSLNSVDRCSEQLCSGERNGQYLISSLSRAKLSNSKCIARRDYITLHCIALHCIAQVKNLVTLRVTQLNS